MFKNKVLPAVLASLSLSSTAIAYEIEHGSHIHGEAVMNIAIEGKKLAVELDSPLFNFTGFEHEAETKEDKQALQQAIAGLQNADKLLLLPIAANCILRDADVELGTEVGHHENHERHEEHHEHEDEEHHEKHAEHDHEEHHDQGGNHQDIHAAYVFSCAKPEAINKIGFAFFKQFPELQAIKVNLISDKGALVKDVTKQSSELSL
ncbi:MAG: DUF2796 domain-containing protein [Neptuniibacter sp.]